MSGARSSSLLGRMEPTAMKEARPIPLRDDLMWSAFSAVWMWLYSLDCLYALNIMDSATMRPILPNMSSSVAIALTFPPEDGRSAVNETST